MMVNSCNVQTRLAALGNGEMLLCLFPGTDRGNLGIAGKAAQNDLLLGPKPTTELLTAVAGDWWETYRFAVQEIYDFSEPRQTVPVSEIQHGISRYLLSDEVWEPTLGTMKSWPERDPHNWVVRCVDAFSFYGATYSVPTYWARYVMCGDKLAMDRCRSIVTWLCRSGIRVQSGPASGAFFNLQRFPTGQPVTLDKIGCTQAGTEILTSQSTGSALWTLLYYRHVSGEKDAELDRTIDQAAEWLLKTQLADGG